MGFGTCRCDFKKSRVCALWWGWRCFLQLSRLSKRRTCICLRTERILVSTIQPIPLHFPKLVYLAGSINTQQLGMLCHWLTGVCKSHRSPFFLTSPSCYLQSLIHFLFSIEQNVVLVAACILTVRLFPARPSIPRVPPMVAATHAHIVLGLRSSSRPAPDTLVPSILIWVETPATWWKTAGSLWCEE